MKANGLQELDSEQRIKDEKKNNKKKQTKKHDDKQDLQNNIRTITPKNGQW